MSSNKLMCSHKLGINSLKLHRQFHGSRHVAFLNTVTEMNIASLPNHILCMRLETEPHTQYAKGGGEENL